MDHLDQLIAYENGELDEAETIELFQSLIKMPDWREICQHIADRNERNQTPQAVARRERAKRVFRLVQHVMRPGQA